MTRFSIYQPAEDGTRFASDAFDGSIGKPISIDVSGVGTYEGVLVAAKVVADGQAVELTIEWGAAL